VSQQVGERADNGNEPRAGNRLLSDLVSLYLPAPAVARRSPALRQTFWIRVT
jgi:hypothetical protein